QSEAAWSARLWDMCRAMTRPQLERLAQRLDSFAGWNDLVLPAAETGTLRLIADQVRHRETVYETWGFRRKERHWEDPGGRGPGQRAGARPLPDRPRRGGQQVHWRDREEPWTSVRGRRGRRRGPLLRRGRRPLRQAIRGEGQPRPVCEPRSGLPAPADGDLPRAGRAGDESEGCARSRVPAAAPVRGAVSLS